MLYRFTSLRRTTEPAALAVSRSTAKSHLRVTGTDEDTLIDLYIAAAVQHVEDATGRSLINQGWTMKLDGFSPLTRSRMAALQISPSAVAAWSRQYGWSGDRIVLPRPPLTAVTAFTYLDADGVLQTVDPSIYTTDAASDPGMIRLDPDSLWPETDDTDPSVTIVYTAGFGAAETNIPAAIRQALLLLVGHFYENREASSSASLTPVPMAVDSLLSPFRVLQV